MRMRLVPTSATRQDNRICRFPGARENRSREFWLSDLRRRSIALREELLPPLPTTCRRLEAAKTQFVRDSDGFDPRPPSTAQVPPRTLAESCFAVRHDTNRRIRGIWPFRSP